MSDGHDLLAQGIVDARLEERFAANGRTTKPEPLALCTLSDDCQAEADDHQDGCPAEARLREAFGF